MLWALLCHNCIYRVKIIHFICHHSPSLKKSTINNIDTCNLIDLTNQVLVMSF